MLAGRDIFATTTPFWKLYFIYPPIAAIVMTPLAFGPYTFWQLVWTAGLVWAQQSVLRRCGVAARLEARADRGRGGAGRRADPDHAGLRPGEHHADGAGGGRPAARTDARRERPADPAGQPDRSGRRDQAHPGAVRGLRLLDRPAPGGDHGDDQLRRLHRDRRDPVAAAETLVFFGGLSGGNTRTASPLYTGNQSLLGVFFRLVGSALVTTLVGLACRGHRRAARRPGRRPVVAAGPEGVRGGPGRADHLPRLAAVLDPPLRLDPAVGRGRCSVAALPRWVRWLGGFWVVWVCVCLPLAVLPYGGARERQFDVLQQVMANLGPVLGVVLIAGLAWQSVRHHPTPLPRARPRT